MLFHFLLLEMTLEIRFLRCDIRSAIGPAKYSLLDLKYRANFFPLPAFQRFLSKGYP